MNIDKIAKEMCEATADIVLWQELLIYSNLENTWLKVIDERYAASLERRFELKQLLMQDEENNKI